MLTTLNERTNPATPNSAETSPVCYPPAPSSLISPHNPSKNNTAYLCLRFGFPKPAPSDKCDVHKIEQHHGEKKKTTTKKKPLVSVSTSFLGRKGQCLVEVSLRGWGLGWGWGSEVPPASERGHISAFHVWGLRALNSPLRDRSDNLQPLRAATEK